MVGDEESHEELSSEGEKECMAEDWLEGHTVCVLL
jgi:hypothetical protein